MAPYAENTSVPTERSRGEIESILRRYGADQFVSGWDQEKAMLGFRVRPDAGSPWRHVRFELPMPDINDTQFRLTPAGRYERSKKDQLAEHDKEVRRRWRALVLVVKAKLEAIESGIATFDDEFLAYIVLPNGNTVSEMLGSGLETALASGELPPLLPSGKSR